MDDENISSSCIIGVVLIVVVVLAVLFWPTVDSEVDAIGNVRKIQSFVGHRRPWKTFHEVEDDESLYENDFVKVTKKGKAQLTFGSIKVYVTNESQLKTETDPNAMAIINLLLKYGGVIVEKAPGEEYLVINTPVDNKRIIINGTSMFVNFDPKSGKTVVGNVDGHVQVETRGMMQNVPSGFYVIIPENQHPEPARPIPITSSQLHGETDNGLSLYEILDVNGMLDDNSFVPTEEPEIIEAPVEEP